MKTEKCLCFCEMLIKCLESGCGFEDVIKKALMISRYDKCDRVYIGSNFCSQYFFHINVEKALVFAKFCKAHNIEVTLCLPIFTQKDLSMAKEYIEQYAVCFGSWIDEITVNDYGMLAYVSERYKAIKINVGRLLNKDTRDIRYNEFSQMKYTPAALTNGQFSQYSVNCIELDPIHAVIQVPAKNFMVAVYKPYCYITFGQICEYASVGLPIEKKFRPNSLCNATCMKVYTCYNSNGGQQFYKIGRTVYCRINSVEISGVKSYREIYELFDMVGEL